MDRRSFGPVSVLLVAALHFDRATRVGAAAAIMQALSCSGADVCDYFLQAYSPSSAFGCWTDYMLSVRKIRDPRFMYLPIVEKIS